MMYIDETGLVVAFISFIIQWFVGFAIGWAMKSADSEEKGGTK